MRPIALIGARGGSQRVPGKNIRSLNGHPLVAYSIRAAIDSGVFDRVVVSTDSIEIEEYCENFVNVHREMDYELKKNPTDFDWIDECRRDGEFWFFTEDTSQYSYDTFAIIRPTTPFRKPETIRAMWEAYEKRNDITSMRSMCKVHEHPMKMWEIFEKVAKPLMEESELMQLYNQPTQKLKDVYVQNSSVEFCKTANLDGGSWSGDVIAPFVMDAIEGFDINTELDWAMAEQLIKEGEATLPEVG